MPLTKKLSVDRSKPVLVTGATGYLAGVLVRQLLGDGLVVHATVRDPSNTERLKYLQAAADECKSTGARIKFFRADLMEEGSFAEAMNGCSVVFHTASPFLFNNNVTDPDRDLIQPAVKGTENVLHEANRTPSVKRIVLTGSSTSIATNASESLEAPGQVLTEEVWSRTASYHHMPYCFSKSLAEQAAWVIAGGQKQWKLVVINPTLILGPGLHYSPSSESYNALLKVAGGRLETLLGVPAIPCIAVDVRDVAEAHRAAAFLSDASGRYIVNSLDSTFFDIAKMLAAKPYTPSAQYPIPSRVAPIPKFLMWIAVPLLPNLGLDQKYISQNINYAYNFDNSKSQRELGLEYRPLDEGVQEMYQQLIDAGAVQPRRWYHALI
jgi:nucleoside-diphosphate-sugar epimerase